MNAILAGLTAGIILAVVFVIHALIRRTSLVRDLQASDDSIASMSEQTLFYLLLGGLVAASLLFGVIAGLVYGWLGVPVYYYIAFGAAILLSIIAVVTKTPMLQDKIFWNLAVGVILGLLVPFMAT